MHTGKKKTSLLTFLTILMLSLTLFYPTSAYAADAKDLLVDDSALLTDEEATELETRLNEISKAHQMDFVIYTENNSEISSAMEAADDFYDYNGYGYGDDHSGIVLYINLSTRDVWLSTCGEAITTFTDEGISYIVDELTPSLSDGYYATAFSDYITLCDEFATQAETGEPYDVGNMPREPFPAVRNIFISLIVGAIIGAIYLLILRGQLKSVAPNDSAVDYVVADSLHLDKQHEFFLYQTVSKTAKPKDTGGGSSTHHSSSGSSHGGGGGKF